MSASPDPRPLLDARYRTSAGVPEVTAAWVAKHLDRVHVVDVREAHELVGDLQPIDGAEHCALATVPARAPSWTPEDPLVVVCRSGGRSGMAAVRLERMGFTAVASMAGGMLTWRSQALAS